MRRQLRLTVDLQPAVPVLVPDVGSQRLGVLGPVMEDELAETRCAVGASEKQRRPRLVEAVRRVVAARGVVLDFGGHDHRVLGLTGTDHVDGDMARVEESDGAVEHVEGKGLGVIRRLDVVIDPQFAGHECGDGRFADEVVPVDPGMDHQTDR